MELQTKTNSLIIFDKTILLRGKLQSIAQTEPMYNLL